MASEHTVTKVLLEWINSFALGKTLRATDELTDGTIIWEILQDIDPQYFLDELPERNLTDHWVAKWQNLKHIHKALISYIRSQNEDEVHPGLDPSPDLEAIAEKNNVRETNKLLKLLLMAVISSPNAETYVEKLQNLDMPTQHGLKDIIEQAHNGQYEPADMGDEAKDGLTKRDHPVDLELQFEERVGKVIAENDRLTHEKKETEKAMEDLHNRIARLQENNDTLQNRLASTEDRLTNLKSGKGDYGPNAKALETKARQQDDIIASQEEKISASQEELDSLRMSMESLRVKNQRLQKLQDDYDELKTEKDGLARKANAAEKYRQKLQASQDFEKENQTLRNQIRDLQQQLRDSDSQHRWNADHNRELEEYRRILPHIEQDRSEIQDLKKQLEFNNHALTERLNSAEEQRERDETMISELRERLREYEISSPSFTPRSSTPKSHGTLQRDMEESGSESSQCVSPALSSEFELTLDRKPESDEPKSGPKPQAVGDTPGYLRPETDDTSQPTRADDSPSVGPWKPDEKTLNELSSIQEMFDSTKRYLSDGLTNREFTDRVKFHLRYNHTYRWLVGLVNKEKADMVNEDRTSKLAELDQHHEGQDDMTRKLGYLRAESDAFQALLEGVRFERDEQNEALDNKQAEFRAEDQESKNELNKLLELIKGEGIIGVDPSQKSNTIVKQLADIMEKGNDRLAQRAEVSARLSSLPDIPEFCPVKNLDESRPWGPILPFPPPQNKRGSWGWFGKTN